MPWVLQEVNEENSRAFERLAQRKREYKTSQCNCQELRRRLLCHACRGVWDRTTDGEMLLCGTCESRVTVSPWKKC